MLPPSHRHENPAKVGEMRLRSLQHRSPFVVAVCWSSLHYLCVIASLTAIIAFFLHPTQLATRVIAASLVASGASWLIAYFRRRAAHCPLCKGTPLLNSGARTHQKSVRLGPINHGVTATLSIIGSQKFHCMYCGSPFDMLKTPSRIRHRMEALHAATSDADQS